jgi:hypothetical protein
MPNGKLKLYNKSDNTLLADLNIVGIINIEDNLNDTPSNMKIKAVTSNEYREEFEVNTIAYHEDTNTNWVIKSDSSTYLTTGEYEHEIELVEYFEWLNYRHLPTCSFKGGRYSLRELLNGVLTKSKIQKITSQTWATSNITDYNNAELKITLSGTFSDLGNFFIAVNQLSPTEYIDNTVIRGALTTSGFFYAKINRVYTIGIEIPNFIDENKKQPFFSFENFTVASAIKSIGRAINAIPKLKIVSGQTILYFISRSGNDSAILDNLNTRFPVAFEKNSNTQDQFTTRSISNLSNVLSNELVVAPKVGGFGAFSPNSFKIERADARFVLPSKIASVEYIVLLPRFRILVLDGVTPIQQVFEGYYIDPVVIKQKLVYFTYDPLSPFDTNPSLITNIVMPSVDLLKISLDDELGTHDGTPVKGYFTLKRKIDFDLTELATDKAKTFWFQRNEDYVNIASGFIGTNVFANNYVLVSNSGYSIVMNFDLDDLTLYRVGYTPIGDIKISYDNDNESQDEKFFNQVGQLLDSKATSKLVISYTNESVSGTKIRQAKHTSYSSILPLGQIIRETDGQLYIISSRSIDALIFNENEYYDVVYVLSNNRIARSEILVADSEIISYEVQQNQLVERNQLYKDYIELSLSNINQETPYLPLGETLVLSSSLSGNTFDYLMFGRSTYLKDGVIEKTPFMLAPSIYDLSKSKLLKCYFNDNNIIGFKLDKVSTNFIQTPINYVGSTNNTTTGELYNLETLLLTSSNVFALTDQYITDNYTPTSPSDPDDDAYYYGLPFNQNPLLLLDYYDLSKDYASLTITENLYLKDLYEIPSFSYMIQANDNYDSKGNIVVGDNLFTSFTSSTSSIRYHYVINNTTRFTSENADRLFVTPTSDERRVLFLRSGTNNEVLDLDLFNTLVGFPSGVNTSTINNIGIYATDGTTTKFLFAINDYVVGSGNDLANIRIYINNWRI